jgi:hypothetical protein
MPRLDERAVATGAPDTPATSHQNRAAPRQKATPTDQKSTMKARDAAFVITGSTTDLQRQVHQPVCNAPLR